MSTPAKQTAAAPSLVRALGVTDLTWLYVVAVVNLNVVPPLAAEGLRIGWIWIAALLCFFLPQAIAVIELAERMPGEGGLYLWTRETRGDFNGFLCGWCYWLTNMFFVPSLLFYVTGVVAYLGAGALADSRIFFLILTNLLLWTTVFANIRGLGVGKWVNNIGGVGAMVIAAVLIGLAVVVFGGGGSHAAATGAAGAGFPLSMLGVVCLALVGLEIGSVMGDEIREPRRTLPRAIVLGGILCAVAYFGSTMALALSVPKSEIAVVQGVIQAMEKMSATLHIGWIVAPLTIFMIASIAGSTSAWVSGSARILFVCGLDRYLPRSLGRVHPKHGSPYVALALFGVLATGIIFMSFVGASVKDAYLTLLNLSAAMQMISYAYLFSALIKIAFARNFRRTYFSQPVLCVVSATGFAMTIVAFVTAFVPSEQVSSTFFFEIKMVATLLALLGLAAGLFFYYRRQKAETIN